MKRMFLFLSAIVMATVSFARVFDFEEKDSLVGVVQGKPFNIEIGECEDSDGQMNLEIRGNPPEGLSIESTYDEEDDETDFYITGLVLADPGTYSMQLYISNTNVYVTDLTVKVVTADSLSATYTGSSSTLPVGGYQGDDEIKYTNLYAHANLSLTLENGEVTEFSYSTSHNSDYGDWHVSTSWFSWETSWRVVKYGEGEAISISGYRETTEYGYFEYYADVCIFSDGSAKAYVGYYEYDEFAPNHELYIWEEDDEPGAPIILEKKIIYPFKYEREYAHGGMKITSCDSDYEGALEIPETIEGYPVTVIGINAFYDCDGLTSITIPASVVDIEMWAFDECSNVQISVASGNSNYASQNGALFNKAKTTLIRGPGAVSDYTIPSGVTTVGTYAFSGCESLTSVTIPASVQTVESSVFAYCYDLEAVYFEGCPIEEVSWGAFSYGVGYYRAAHIEEWYTALGNSLTGWWGDLYMEVNPDDGEYCVVDTVVEGSGSVTGGGIYQTGTSVQMTATPEDGYRFVGWYLDGEVQSTEATWTISATDMEISAVFSVLLGFDCAIGHDEAVSNWLKHLLHGETGFVVLGESTDVEDLDNARLLGIEPECVKNGDEIAVSAKTTFDVSSIKVGADGVTLTATVTVEKGVIPSTIQLGGKVKVKVMNTLSEGWAETLTFDNPKLTKTDNTYQMELDLSGYNFYQVTVTED